jgi:preprotein translocase subunit SecE
MTKKPDNPVETAVTQEESVFSRFSRYVEGARAELRKITWPTLAMTRKASLAVLAFVAVMAVLLGLVDLCLSSLIKTLLS